MKKGFTLVELLAVIVILAIILVIAVPQIGKVVKKTKVNSLASTAKVIAAKAEEQEVENQAIEIDNEISCNALVKLDENYGECTVYKEEGKWTVTLVGANKFEGITCTGTKTYMDCTGSTGEPQSITLTVDLNGGSSSQEFESTYMNGDTIELINPTRENYEFVNWEVIIGDSTLNNNVLTIGTNDTTIYAVWKSNATLTVDLDGGTSSQTFNERYESGTVIELIPPTKQGYVFTGWEVEEGNGTISGNTYTHGTENTILKAIYIEVTAARLSYDNTKTNVECEDVQCMIDYLSYMLRGE